jgi:hypothetical protein
MNFGNFGNFEPQDYSWLDQFSPLPTGGASQMLESASFEEEFDYSALFSDAPAPTITTVAPLPAAPPMPQLPLMPLVSPPPQAVLTPVNLDSGDVSTTSKKRKTRDEVDPANVINAKRSRKAPRRPDLTPSKKWSERVCFPLWRLLTFNRISCFIRTHAT